MTYSQVGRFSPPIAYPLGLLGPIHVYLLVKIII